MKFCIFYFSGTGNTKKVVDEYQKNLKALGQDVEVKNIELYYDAPFDFDINDYDRVGIAYPVHAFNAPSIILDFAKRLPKLNSKKDFFILKTSGEPLALNNISSTKTVSILKKRGFNLTNEYHYCMPYNIIFRHTDNMAFKMWQTAKTCIPLDCEELVSGKSVKLKHFPCAHFLAWIFRIEHWGGRFNGKRYKVDDKCVKCLACVNRCPTKNISIEDGHFVFGNKCLMCMRCSFFCPTNAIKIGLFNKWKVNGPYKFNHYDESEEQTHTKYCKRSYKKYFASKEAKIASKKV